MDFDLKRFKQMSAVDLAGLVEHASDDYRAVITIDEYFDQQTGAVAVLQKKGEGPETRKWVEMNSGFSPVGRVARADRVHEIQDWAKENGYEQKPHGELVEPGPIRTTSNKQTSSFTREDGATVPYGPKARIGPDGELAVLKHHAEIKILHWAEANGYDVIALAPTRGCCPNCQHELRKVLGENKFKSVVPLSRQTPEAFSEHLQKNLVQDASRPGHRSSPGAVLVGEPAAHAGQRLPAAGEPKLPPGIGKLPALAGKLASHLGNAATALDALGSAAEISKDLQAGHTDRAARKTLEFGGRTWGGIEGAAIGAELGGVAGSIVPGAGTLIGAAAGGVIGGIVGPAVGEDMARRLFDALQKLAPHTAASGGKGQPNQAAPALQRYLFEATSTAVGHQIGDLHQANNAVASQGVFDGLKAHAGEVFKPVVAAGRQMQGKSFVSDAVKHALDRQEHADRQIHHGAGASDRPHTTTSVVGTILVKANKTRGGVEPDPWRNSPLDRDHH